ncbi:MAG: hypothetical protein AAGM67_05390 [Bacteroidota bacterium]
MDTATLSMKNLFPRWGLRSLTMSKKGTDVAIYILVALGGATMVLFPSLEIGRRSERAYPAKYVSHVLRELSESPCQRTLGSFAKKDLGIEDVEYALKVLVRTKVVVLSKSKSENRYSLRHCGASK